MVFCPVCSERLTDVDVTNQMNTYHDNSKTTVVSQEQTVYAGGNVAGGNAPVGGYTLNDPYAESKTSPYPDSHENTINKNDGIQPVYNAGGYAPVVQQPVMNSTNKSSNKGLYVLIGIFAGIIVIAGIIILLLLFDGDGNTGDNNYVYGEQLTEQHETTTQAPATTEPVTQAPTTSAPVTDTEKLNAYYVFNDFYISYLNGINYLDSSMIDHCSQSVRLEMLERFEYNQKSLFDLKRIDFDEASYLSSTSGNKTYHYFYVKCVSEYYDRNTYENKGYNYAVWYVTVIEENGYSYVSSLERNDKYKMGTVVHTITDYSDHTFF